jgi:hypothetical protein
MVTGPADQADPGDDLRFDRDDVIHLTGGPVPCQNLHMGVEVVFLAVISLLCGTR